MTESAAAVPLGVLSIVVADGEEDAVAPPVDSEAERARMEAELAPEV